MLDFTHDRCVLQQLSRDRAAPWRDCLRGRAGGQALTTGLSTTEAVSRLAAYGPNRIEDKPQATLWRAIRGRLVNPLVLVLAAAALLSAVTGDARSSLIIALILCASVTLDVCQEYRADRAAARLKARTALRAQVFRDGEIREIPAAELVPGDVVTLAAGDLVPADGTLVDARDLYVNEALITGESFPAEKHADDPARCRALMGSSVISGTGTLLLTATGRGTQLGAVAHTLVKPPPPPAFALGLRDFSRLIVKITLLLVLFTLLINLALHRPALQSFLFAIALAVGLTPELLPMVVSVSLAHGALRLSRHGVLVRKLPAIHDIGSMDILCSDKTGTLTQASIRLMKHVDPLGADSSRALTFAAVNAHFETGIKSPLDEALLAADPDAGSGWQKMDEVPFDFERRRVSVLAARQGERLLLVKGAPDDIIALCDRYEDARAAIAPLGAAELARARAVTAALEADGLRVLAVGWRHADDQDHACIGDERQLVLAGFLGFLDPPKPDAGQALADLAGLGVRTIVLTGDSEGVSRHVCAALGLEADRSLSGHDMATMSEEALAARLATTSLFYRVSPPQKLRIITALRRKGHVVGYLGDGINDAPALHEADVGFSVEGAVDVAREAASMILLRKDLRVLADGVREGRRTFANISKYVLMGTSSNFGNMFSMAGGALLLPFLPMLPIQILLNNLLYDVSQTAIPLDRIDAAAVMVPRRWDAGLIRRFMMVLGPLSSVFDMLTFFVLLRLGADERLFHTGWFVESLATQLLVIFVIRSRDPLHSRPHPLLVLSTLAMLAVAIALPYTAASAWLGFRPVPASMLAILAGITAAYLSCAFVARRWIFAGVA